FIAEMQLNEGMEIAQRLQSEENSDANANEEVARMVENGHYVKSFTCKKCNEANVHGGIELKNCMDPVCYDCFEDIVDQALLLRQSPQCPTCFTDINIDDVRRHKNASIADQVSEMLSTTAILGFDDTFSCFSVGCGGCVAIENKHVTQFQCPKCYSNNCILCKSFAFFLKKKKLIKSVDITYSHCGKVSVGSEKKKERGRPTKTVILKRKEWISNEYFFKQWEEFKDKPDQQKDEHNGQSIGLDGLAKMCKSVQVIQGSEEWNNVLRYVKDKVNRTWIRIDRIQNGKLWMAYHRYCQSLKEQGIQPEERAFWHGTGQTLPSKIWKTTGFDITFARVGGCLWFAAQNSYSMSGFQHVSGSNCQIFLALVATGVGSDCKFIRGDTILNSFELKQVLPLLYDEKLLQQLFSQNR
ncbi:hypothetical protein RFI_15207, partial [Reticulomyxa filosa]